MSGQTSRTEPIPSETILFQSWVNDRFKKYILPEIEIKEGVDPCESIKKSEKRQARNYQAFISKFMKFDSPFRSMLLYHGVGSGKTCTATMTFNSLYDENPAWNVYVLLRSSIKPIWNDELNKCLTKDEKYNDRRSKIHFIAYNSPNASEIFKRIWTATRITSDQSLFIIDEVHNFISNVVSNKQKGKGRSLETYDLLVDELKRNKNSRILALSATPVINQPYELGVLFNLLNNGIFPDNEEDFKAWFVRADPFPAINPKTKNLFQRRIVGLVSYYIGATPDLYATQKTYEIDINMPAVTRVTYEYWEAIEDEIEKKKALFKRMKKGDQVSDMFRSYTRQCCNFVFPTIGSKISGQLRPHPGDFREKKGQKKQEEALKYDQYGFEKVRKTATTAPLLLEKNAYLEYDKARKHFVAELRKYWKGISSSSKSATIRDDMTRFQNAFDEGKTPEQFMDEVYPKKCSALLKSIYESSPKMTCIALRCLTSPGNTMIYSNYVRMEGIELMCVILEEFGLTKYEPSMKATKGFRYVELHRGIGELSLQEQLKNVFNSKDNKDGSIVKVLLISPAMSEGISFMNVRQMHILEPYWNEVRIDQVKGRGIRQCSHKDLPMDQRHCDIFRYALVRVDERNTTDQEITSIAKRKNVLIKTFELAMREVAIDCQLFKAHNMMENKFNCFRFPANQLLSGDQSYGFRMNIDEDNIKENKGSNSSNYEDVTIDVFLVPCVMKDPIRGTLEKDSQKYLLDKETGEVYDSITTNLVGLVGRDKNGILEMSDSETYIISVTVPIERYTNY